MLENLLKGKHVEILDKYSVQLLKTSDIEDIVNMLQNPKVTEYLFFAGKSRDELYRSYFQPIAVAMEKAIKTKEKPENIIVIIRDKQTQEFIGNAAIVAVAMIEGVYEIGYQLNEKYWRKGIATAASKLLVDILKNDYHAHKIQIDFYQSNIGSKHVAKKLGFEKEGQLKNYYKMANGFDDKVIYGLTLDHNLK